MLTDANLPIFKTTIRRLSAFQKAALKGVPVYESGDPKANNEFVLLLHFS